MPNNDYILRSDALKAILGVSIYDAIEELEGARTIAENTWADGLYDAYKIVEEEVDAADVEPKQRWIPVTEGLPKRPENWPSCELRRCYFLVALESGCVKSLGFEFATMEWHLVGSPVTHWMPLPEPPKKERKEADDV